MSKRRTIIPKGFEFYYEQFHFAPAVRDGKTLYCSGQVGWAGPRPPRRRAIRRSSSSSRSRTCARCSKPRARTSSDVVEITTFHVGMEHIGAFGAVKGDYLKEPYPAWTAIGVAALFMPGLLRRDPRDGEALANVGSARSCAGGCLRDRHVRAPSRVRAPHVGIGLAR